MKVECKPLFRPLYNSRTFQCEMNTQKYKALHMAFTDIYNDEDEQMRKDVEALRLALE